MSTLCKRAPLLSITFHSLARRQQTATKDNLIEAITIEQQVITKLRARDESGITLLYDNYSNSLYGIAVRVLRHQAFAEDALQKSFLKIWNNFDQYHEEKSTLFTWMAQIVRNTAIDIKRLKSFQAEQKSDTFDPLVHNSKSTKIDTDQLDIKTVVGVLEDKYAFVLEYLYLRGYSQSELADEFDMPIGTIKTRVKKALKLLRLHLESDKAVLYGLLLVILLILLQLL